jgi:hypothetical protein
MERSLVNNNQELLGSHPNSAICQFYFSSTSSTSVIHHTRDATLNSGTISPSQLPHADPAAWHVIQDFTITDMSLPDAEAHIKEILGTHYVDGDWRPAFKAVMDVEGDSNVAISAVEQLKKAASHQTGLKI